MNILNKIRNMGTKSKVLVSVVALTAIVSAPFAVNAGFFPGRATFDYNKFTQGEDCNDPNVAGRQGGRCGSMTGPVFNSFVNTPSYGDEREFMDGRLADQTGAINNTDTVKDVTTGSKKVILRMYVHNNANTSTNASGLGVAKNTKVKMELPTQAGSALQAVGAISADNAAPKEVTDTVYMTGSRAFKVSYEAGSAKLLRNNAATPLSDSIVTTGAPIGDKVMDGNLPGCFDYAALVEITVNITPEESNDLQVIKEVKKVGEGTWAKDVTTKPGDEVQYLLTTKNIGLDAQNNVAIRDILPPHLELVKDSVKMVNVDQTSYPQADQPLFKDGLNLGNYPKGGGRYVMFKAKTKGDFSECEIRVRNIAKVRSDQVKTEKEDHADVIIKKENCKPEEVKPVYACDLLTAQYTTGRTVKYTAKASASNGATIKQYVYSFGDGQTITTDKTTVDHTYANDGQYAAVVKVNVGIKDQTVVAESPACATAVTFTSGKPPVTPPTPGTPGTPGTLPETGAGSVIATFVGVTIAGATAYYVVVRRSARI